MSDCKEKKLPVLLTREERKFVYLLRCQLNKNGKCNVSVERTKETGIKWRQIKATD